MDRKISFGKIDYYGEGLRNCQVVVEVKLKKEEVFLANAYVMEPDGSDCIIGGQCLDEILPYLKDDKLFVEIYDLWEKYHLNSHNAGTREQMNALKGRSNGSFETYHDNVKYLKSVNLYEVEYEGEPYLYGHGWIHFDIPKKDLQRIKEIIGG